MMYSGAVPITPVSGVGAVPVNSPPKPSPVSQMFTAQANDTTSAGVTVRRTSSATPIAHSEAAASRANSSWCGAMTPATQVMTSATGAGCPIALGSMTPLTKW